MFRLSLLSLIVCALFGCTKPPPPDENGVTRARLKNGVIILIKEDHREPIVAISTLVKTRETTLDEYRIGLRTLAESLFLENSLKYPEKKTLSKELMRLGGALDASTSIDYSLYQTVIPNFNISKGIKLFQTAYSNPGLKPSDYSDVVRKLIRDGNRVEEIIEGYPIELLPDPTTLGELSNVDFNNYWEERFHPELLVVSIVGDVSTKNIFRLLNNTFGKLKSDQKPPQIKQGATFTESFQFSQTPDDRGTWGTVTFQTEGLANKDRYPLYLLSLWLKNQTPTQVRIARDSGVVQFSLTPEDNDLLTLEKTLFRELNNLKTTPIPEEQLKVFRSQVVFEQYKTQASIQTLSKALAIEEQYGDYQNALIQGNRLANVTTDDVKGLSKRYFSIERANVEEYSNLFPKGLVDKETRKKDLIFPETETSAENKTSPTKSKEIAPIKVLPKELAKESKATMFLVKEKIPAIFQEEHTVPLVAITIMGIESRLNENIDDIGSISLALRSALHTPLTGDIKPPTSIIAALGGKLEFSSTTDSSGFTLEILSQNLKEGLKSFIKLVTDPQANNESIDNERKKMIEELQDQKLLSPFSNSLQLSLEFEFEKHPYIFPSQGTEASLNKQSVEKIIEILKTYFKSNNLIITAVGDFDSVELQSLLNQELTQLQYSPKPQPQELAFPLKPEGITHNIESGVPITYSAQTLLFNGPKPTDPEFPTINLLTNILGGPVGKLQTVLVEKDPTAYKVSAVPILSKYLASVAIMSQIPPGEETGTVDSIFKVIKQISKDGVSPQETKEAYLYVLTQDQANLEDYLTLANRLSMDWLVSKDTYSINQYHKGLEKVTANDIKAASIKYLLPNDYVLGLSKSIESYGGEEK